MNPALTHYVPVNIKSIFISLLSGLATPLGFEPFGLYPVPFFTALIIILLSINSNRKDAFIYGYLFGLGFFGYGVNWLHISINLFGGINLPGAFFITFLLVLYLAVFPALFAYLISLTTNNKKLSITHLFSIPAIWTLLEWTRGWLFTGFPWLNLGYSQTDSIFSGLAPVLGVYGISYVIMLTVVILLFIYRGARRIQGMATCLLLLICLSAWLANNRDWAKDTNSLITVALIQGAIPQEIKWSPDMRQPTKDLYLDLTTRNLNADLIIWPEAAIPAYFHQEQNFLNDVHRLIKTNDAALLTGMPVYDRDSDVFYNGVVYLEDTANFYYKQHLVPFGEYLPLKFLLQPLVDILNIPMADFSPGEKARPILQSDRFKIGISICYEDTFGNEVIRALPDANILVNISNDAWFGDSLAPHQHLQMARMRAQESGRYLLRATNTGITAIIDNKGKILDQSPQFLESSIQGEARLYEGATPYSKFGNFAIIIFCLLVLGISEIHKRINIQN